MFKHCPCLEPRPLHVCCFCYWTGEELGVCNQTANSGVAEAWGFSTAAGPLDFPALSPTKPDSVSVSHVFSEDFLVWFSFLKQDLV